MTRPKVSRGSLPPCRSTLRRRRWSCRGSVCRCADRNTDCCSGPAIRSRTPHPLPQTCCHIRRSQTNGSAYFSGNSPFRDPRPGRGLWGCTTTIGSGWAMTSWCTRHPPGTGTEDLLRRGPYQSCGPFTYKNYKTKATKPADRLISAVTPPENS